MASINLGSGSGSGFADVAVTLSAGAAFEAAQARTALYSKQVLNAEGAGQVVPVDLASGANTLTAPVGARGLIFVPPESNTTVALTAKGVTGDTGIPMAYNAPYMAFFPTEGDGSTATLVITAASALTGCKLVWL